MGGCDKAPVVAIGHALHEHATVDSVAAAVAAGETHPHIPAYPGLDAYRAGGGYRAAAGLPRRRAQAVEEVIEALEHSGLRGLGGAGFPTGRKWRFVRQEPAPRLMAVNADEGEPGTFKDRYFLETDPHRFLEGMLIAAWAVEAAEIYIYLRDEYPQCRAILETRDRRGRGGGAGAAYPHPPAARRRRLYLRRGIGDARKHRGQAAACRASKPPFPAQVGLFGRPTLINNVETLFWVRDIVEKGPEWFTGQGRNGRKGLRTFSVSGRVREPGVKLAPAGITARELIDEFCGGMADGHMLQGLSAGRRLGRHIAGVDGRHPARFRHARSARAALSARRAVVVLSDQDDMKAVALNLLRFFEDESCGQCTPCRVGTEKAVKLMTEPHWDEALLDDLTQVMGDASICGLGQAAMNPVKQVLKHFREDLRRDCRIRASTPNRHPGRRPGPIDGLQTRVRSQWVADPANHSPGAEACAG